MIKNNKGSLSIEAAISLTITICFVASILLFAKMVYIHTIIQHALIETSDEIASYSYLAKATGVLKINDNINNGVDMAKNDINPSIDNILNTYKSVSDVYDSTADLGSATSFGSAADDVASIITDSNSAINNGKQAVDSISTLLSNPGQLLIDIESIFEAGVFDAAKTAAGGNLAKILMCKYLTKSTDTSANGVLQKLGIVGGLGGLDFANSTFLEDDNSIDLIVCYQFKTSLPFNFLPEVDIVQRADSRAWVGK